MTVSHLAAAHVVEPELDRASAEQARLLNAARARLLRSATAITTAMFADALGISEDAARGRIKRHRAASRIVTVSYQGEALIPTFQLDEAYDVDPLAAHVVATLTDAGLGPWAIWDWAQTPNGWLDNATPAEIIRAGDEESIEAALAGLLDAA